MDNAGSGSLPPLRLKQSLIAVAVGGFVGSILRYEFLRMAASSQSASDSAWSLVPWRLIVLNTLGVAVAAWLLAGPLRGRSPDDPWRLASVTGLLGGLTSYSTLIADLHLMQARSIPAAAVTLVGALVAGLAAAFVAIAVARR